MSETVVIDAEDAHAARQRKKRAERRRELRRKDRQDVIIGPTGVVWSLVEGRPKLKEVLRLEGTREVLHTVDTAIFCYSMLCNCGRTRYAKPNALHEVLECRVCARETKLARRAIRERGRPAGKPFAR